MKKVKSIIILMLVIITSCNKVADIFPSSKVNKDKLIELVNDARMKGCNCGDTWYPPVAPITWNDKLATAAEKHSTDMRKQNYFAHQGKDGSSPGDRIAREDYLYSTYGENIAEMLSTSREKSVISAWLDSPGHCRNIMNAKFKEMGVGRSGKYWTQKFATKK